MNRVLVSGEVIGIPERKEFSGGASVATVSLKVARPGKAGEPARFDTIAIEAWRETGERLAALVIGDRILADAHLRSNEWTAQDGSPRSRLVLSVNTFVVLPAPRSAAPVRAAAPVPAGDDYTMPF